MNRGLRSTLEKCSVATTDNDVKSVAALDVNTRGFILLSDIRLECVTHQDRFRGTVAGGSGGDGVRLTPEDLATPPPVVVFIPTNNCVYNIENHHFLSIRDL